MVICATQRPSLSLSKNHELWLSLSSIAISARCHQPCTSLFEDKQAKHLVLSILCRGQARQVSISLSLSIKIMSFEKGSLALLHRHLSLFDATRPACLSLRTSRPST